MKFFKFFSSPGYSSQYYKEYLSFTDKAMTQVEAGDMTCLKTVYSIFATSDCVRIRRGGEVIRKALQHVSITGMMRLDEAFRQCTSMEWTIDWSRISLSTIREQFACEQDYTYALILGTFHPNGYYREKCLLELADSEGSLPYLLLRLNDWVAPVRKRAVQCCEIRVPKASMNEIVSSCVVLEKLQRSERCLEQDVNTIIEEIIQRFETLQPEMDLNILSKYDFHERKALYKLFIAYHILTFEQMNDLLEIEPHGNCKTLLICALIAHKQCTMEQIDYYMENKSGCIRKKALEYKYEVLHNTWNGLEWKLLDSNRGIRENVVFILRKHTDLNIREFYMEHLQDENPETAIMGLSESGKSEDWNLLLPFLKSRNIRLLGAVLTALSRFPDFDGYELYWNYLDHPDITVIKAAYTAILKKDYHYGAKQVYNTLMQKQDDPSARYYLRLLTKEKSWDRLPYVLTLYAQNTYPKENFLLLRTMTKRYMYEKVSPAQAEKVRQTLIQYGSILPPGLVQSVEFDLKLVSS